MVVVEEEAMHVNMDLRSIPPGFELRCPLNGPDDAEAGLY